jgi:hypothetical protein
MPAGDSSRRFGGDGECAIATPSLKGPVQDALPECWIVDRVESSANRGHGLELDTQMIVAVVLAVPVVVSRRDQHKFISHVFDWTL